MPEYAYPFVEPNPSWWVIALHVTLLGVSLVPLVGLFKQSRRPATAEDAYAWIGCLICAPIPFAFVISVLSPHAQPFAIGLLVFTEVVCLLALVITIARLCRQGNAVRAGIIVGGVLGMTVLVAVLLPSVPSAREASRRMQCFNNLKQIMIAVHTYHDEFGKLPRPISTNRDKIEVSWRIVMAPYLDLRHISDPYDRAQPWDSAANQRVARARPSTLLCPSNTTERDDQQRYFTAYSIPVGPDAPFSNAEPRRMADFAKGTSNIIGLVEACGRNIVWTQPADVDLTTLPIGVNRNGEKPGMSNGMVSSMHPGGANAATLDGAVRFLNNDIDQTTLRQLLSSR